MKLAAMIVPLLAFFLAQCSSDSTHGVQRLRDDSTAPQTEGKFLQATDTIIPKSRKVYKVAVGNADSSSIGYEEPSEAAGFGSGPGAIDIWGEYVFIVDTYHNNIKRLDLETGGVIVSSHFLPPGVPPVEDVAVKDGLVYILNASDTLYVLDKELKLEKKVALLEEFWRRRQMLLHWQNQPVKVYIPRSMIATVLPAEVAYDSSQYEFEYHERLLTSRLIPLSSNTDSTQWYAQLPSGTCLQLEEPLPQLDLWWAMNMAVDSTRFAYFYATSKEFKVHIYTF